MKKKILRSVLSLIAVFALAVIAGAANAAQFVPVLTDEVDSGKPPVIKETQINYPGPLLGKRAAIIAANGFEESEVAYPLEYLEKRGSKVDILSPEGASGRVMSVKFLKPSAWVPVTKSISRAKAEDYDMVIIPGGAWSPIILRSNTQVLDFVKKAFAKNILVASLCHGPQVLISAGVIKGRTATAFGDILIDMRNAGAIVVEDRPVVIDGNLITSRDPNDLADFCQAIEMHFAPAPAPETAAAPAVHPVPVAPYIPGIAPVPAATRVQTPAPAATTPVTSTTPPVPAAPLSPATPPAPAAPSIPASAPVAVKPASEGWEIDHDMKFNLGYLITADQKVKGVVEKPRDMGFSKSFLPDITNITYKGFSDLGFPIPAVSSPETFNVFIKLFEFPESFVPRKSAIPIIEGFALDRLDAGKEVIGYSLNKRNLAVKLSLIAKSDSVFSPQTPYPAFEADASDAGAQSEFNRATLFSSLYLTPKTLNANSIGVDEIARHSASGVRAFHKDILAVYDRDFMHLSSVTGGKYHIFGLKTGGEKGRETVLTVIKVPYEPMVFNNWRDLPMPHDPSKIFLSGLLLIYRDEYVPRGGVMPEIIPQIGSSAFACAFEKKSSHVLEIGSVVKLKF